MTQRGHKIALDPTEAQRRQFARAAGCARFAYNWGLSQWKSQYKAGLKPSAVKLKKEFNSLKREQFPWIMQSPKGANQRAFRDLGAAFKNFFDGLKGIRPKVGYPTFKKKGRKDSFYVENDKFRLEGKHCVLPVIGRVKMFEALRFEGKILSGRVSREADRWYLSVQVQVVEGSLPVHDAAKRPAVGVDLGIKTTVVTSSGQKFEAPKPLKAALDKLRRANRKLHRRMKGSNNRAKSKLEVAKIHARISHIRKDFWHKVTTQLARENQTVVVEDLNIQGMVRNRKLSRALVDVSLGMFRPMIAYKAEKVIVADRWYPSTKRCSACGNVREKMTLSDRMYVCDCCGHTQDRDENAAVNLELYPGLQGKYACGEISSTRLQAEQVTSLNQEPTP